MNHVTHQIQAFLDGELPPQKALAFRGHLHRCKACRQAFEDRQQLWHRVDALAAVPAGASVWPRLAGLLERRRRQNRSWTFRSLAVAATVAGMLLGWQLGGPVQTRGAGAGAGAALDMSFLEDTAPSLDQLWLQVGVNGGPGS